MVLRSAAGQQQQRGLGSVSTSRNCRPPMQSCSNHQHQRASHETRAHLCPTTTTTSADAERAGGVLARRRPSNVLYSRYVSYVWACRPSAVVVRLLTLCLVVRPCVPVHPAAASFDSRYAAPSRAMRGVAVPPADRETRAEGIVARMLFRMVAGFRRVMVAESLYSSH